MAVIGELATLITARTEPFTKGLKTAGAQAKTFSNTISNTLGGGLRKVSGMLTSTTGLIAGLGGAMTVGGLLSRSIKLASSYEDMQTAFAVYLKDAQKAKLVMADLAKFSDPTKFGATEVQEAGKQLLAFGFQADSLMKDIYLIGTLAAGSQKPMAEFVDILGKVKASGVASMGDVNRLADRGVPIFQELAKVTGVATSEVRELVGSSKVGFQEIYQALKNVTTGSGLFAGALEKLGETSSSKLNTLKGTIDSVLRDVGSAILEGLNLKGLAENLTTLATTYRQDIVDATTQGVAALQSGLSGIAGFLEDAKGVLDIAGVAYHGAMAGAARLGQMTNVQPGNWEGLGVLSRIIGSRLSIGPSPWAMEAGPRHQAAYEAGLQRLSGASGYGSPMQNDRQQQRIAEASESTARTIMDFARQYEAENEMRRRAYQNQIDMYGGIVEILD